MALDSKGFAVRNTNTYQALDPRGYVVDYTPLAQGIGQAASSIAGAIAQRQDPQYQLQKQQAENALQIQNAYQAEAQQLLASAQGGTVDPKTGEQTGVFEGFADPMQQEMYENIKTAQALYGLGETDVPTMDMYQGVSAFKQKSEAAQQLQRQKAVLDAEMFQKEQETIKDRQLSIEAAKSGYAKELEQQKATQKLAQEAEKKKDLARISDEEFIKDYPQHVILNEDGTLNKEQSLEALNKATEEERAFREKLAKSRQESWMSLFGGTSDQQQSGAPMTLSDIIGDSTQNANNDVEPVDVTPSGIPKYIYKDGKVIRTN